jgi:hypothetical protein
MKSLDKQTPKEWQDAVNAADFAVRFTSPIQSATGGRIKLDRAREILGRGLQLGFVPESTVAQNARYEPVTDREFNELCESTETL